MGLPIFREPTPAGDSQSKTKDSHAIRGHPRTSIGRRDTPVWARPRSIRSPPPRYHPTAPIPVPPIPWRHLDGSLRPPRRSENYSRPRQPSPQVRISRPTSPPLINETMPSLPDAGVDNEDSRLQADEEFMHGMRFTASPQPMIHLDDNATSAPPSPSREQQLRELPPLRRMGHRSINDVSSPMTMTDDNGTEYLVSQDQDGYLRVNGNGLGDRQRSPTPDEDQWHTMLTTITPDPSLPSAESSFAPPASVSHTRRPRTSREPRPGRTHTLGPWFSQASTPYQHRFRGPDSSIQGSVGAAMSAGIPNDRTREAARQFSRAVAGESGVIDYAPRPQSNLRNTQNTESDDEEAGPTPHEPEETSMSLGLQRARSGSTFESLQRTYDESPGPGREAVSRLQETRNFRAPSLDYHSATEASSSSVSESEGESSSDSASIAETTPPTSQSTSRANGTSRSTAWHRPSDFRRLDNDAINQLLRRVRAFADISHDLRLHDAVVANDEQLREHENRASRHALNRVRDVVSSLPEDALVQPTRHPQGYSYEQQVNMTRNNLRDYIDAGHDMAWARQRRRRRQAIRARDRGRREVERIAAENRQLATLQMDADLGAAIQMR